MLPPAPPPSLPSYCKAITCTGLMHARTHVRHAGLGGWGVGEGMLHATTGAAPSCGCALPHTEDVFCSFKMQIYIVFLYCLTSTLCCVISSSVSSGFFLSVSSTATGASPWLTPTPGTTIACRFWSGLRGGPGRGCVVRAVT